ncbi:hypothetical protein NDU88_006366 [Pleurodeles waltl]|uniref:Uncharacterized protein n=1 Tax=Pleurodeles waltl TaxID=8319 RepID=A0AAV7TXP1_PLEWA|nr:hypothetical protein NDU88_006366 [Pleurodeles waltl]
MLTGARHTDAARGSIIIAGRTQEGPQRSKHMCQSAAPDFRCEAGLLMSRGREHKDSLFALAASKRGGSLPGLMKEQDVGVAESTDTCENSSCVQEYVRVWKERQREPEKYLEAEGRGRRQDNKELVNNKTRARCASNEPMDGRGFGEGAMVLYRTEGDADGVAERVVSLGTLSM